MRHDRDGLVRKPSDAEPADLQEAGQFGRRSHEQPTVRGRKQRTVIGDQARKCYPSLFGSLQNCEHQARLPASRRTANEDGVCAKQDGGGVNRRRGGADDHHIAGRRTSNRAPITFGASEGSSASTRFSAQMRPWCASTICFEIESPSPELWPNP